MYNSNHSVYAVSDLMTFDRSSTGISGLNPCQGTFVLDILLETDPVSK
jgi:hypothetical protein